MRGRGHKALFFGLEDYGAATSKAVCNFIFASHCQGACLISSQLAGAALSKPVVSFWIWEGVTGARRASCGEVLVECPSGREGNRLRGWWEDQE